MSYRFLLLLVLNSRGWVLMAWVPLPEVLGPPLPL
jgi:hypothetical protein